MLVEGEDEKRVFPELIEANGVPWGETADSAVVFIEHTNGFSDMIRPGAIETELKASGLQFLGIIIDADENAFTRWNQIRNQCISLFPTMPADMPAEGLILQEPLVPKFGLWIMPDNANRGMLETFLTYLVPDGADPVLHHAIQSRDAAKALGAPFSDAHADKSTIHTWLAWQDPPGQQLHRAVIQRILNPSSPSAAAFIAWFRSLYEI